MNTYIADLGEFVSWTAQFDSEQYLFRGVEHDDYDITASAVRRFSQGMATPANYRYYSEKFGQINRELINQSRLKGFGRKDGHNMKDLEILADLQHFGAATCLIDFTYNSLVALYFACKQSPGNTPKNGKVVALNTGITNKKHRFTDITFNLLEKDIDFFLQGTNNFAPWELYKWQPSHQNMRIVAQQSIFVFGAMHVFTDGECIIDLNGKTQILKDLNDAHGINEASLFPDFDGFAKQYGHNVQYTKRAATEYYQIGKHKMEDGKYKEAIDAFTEVINLRPNDSLSYYKRASAWSSMYPDSSSIGKNVHNIILDDYTKAIDLNSEDDYENADIYYEMAIFKNKHGEAFSASLDLEKALDIAEKYELKERIIKIRKTLSDVRESLPDVDIPF